MNTSFAVINWLIVTILMAWVVTDAARRRRNWLAWVMPFLFFGGVFGVIPWLIVRRRTPVAEPLGFRRGLALSLAVIPIQLLMVLVMLNIVTFLFQVARVEGQAMAPTLADQDRLIVNKLAYRMASLAAGMVG
jgi:signal peptidase S26 family